MITAAKFLSHSSLIRILVTWFTSKSITDLVQELLLLNMEWISENIISEIAEEIAEQMGISIPVTSNFVKVAGVLVTTEVWN